MLETKLFEVRDRSTFIPVLAVRLSGSDDPLLRRAGYGNVPYVLLAKVEGGATAIQYDPFRWENRRTMTNAHLHILNRWDELRSGDVVDVEYILGEVSEPKASEVR